MTTIFVSNSHFQVAGNEPEFILNNTFHLVTDKEVPRSWAKDSGDFILNKFGVVMLETLTRCPCYVRVIIDEGSFLKEMNMPNMETLSMFDVITLQAFNLYSWVVKDNSVNVNTYFYHNDSSKNVFLRGGNVKYCNCHGLYSDTVFTVQELEEAWAIFHKIPK